MATATDGYAGQGHYTKPTARLLETIGIELHDKDGELLPAYSYLRSNKQKTGLTPVDLSLIHISEPTRPRLISYAVFCL